MLSEALYRFLVERIKARFSHAKLKLILYGSRARGDHRDRSDIDLAVQFELPLSAHWSAFAIEVREDAPTLLKIDLVLFNECAKELQESILKEGKILYEQ